MSKTTMEPLVAPEFGEYSLEPIITEYREAAAPDEPYGPDARIRQIVLDALNDTLRQRRAAAQPERAFDEPPAEPAEDLPFYGEDFVPGADTPAAEEAPEAPSAFPAEPTAASEPQISFVQEEDGGVSEFSEAPDGEPPLPEQEADESGESLEDGEESAPDGPVVRRRTAEQAQEQEDPLFERLRAPFVRYFAIRAARRSAQEAEAAAWPEPEDENSAPELPPKKAARFYARQIGPMRTRGRLAAVLCLILLWISLGLPCLGALGSNLAVKAGVCLILLLAVMMISLDVLTTGLRQLLELAPGLEAPAALAAVFSCLDALLVMLGAADQLPFCFFGALNLTAALWCDRQLCVASAISLKAAAKAPSVLAAQLNAVPGGGLMRCQRAPEGFVRHLEKPDFPRSVYAVAAPILMGLAFLLSLIASIGQFGSFLHIFSALLCVSASFISFFCYPLPFVLAARRLRASGAAVAGWAGSRDIGKSRRVVITDYDLFPPGTMKLTGINIQEGVNVGKAVSYTASLLAASGSGLAYVFDDLMTRRKYDLVKVEDFKLLEGGGLSAFLHGEEVLVGSVSFMNLMGIRMPLNMDTKNAVCTVLSHELVGVFNLEYTPVESVRQALSAMVDSRTQPVFAVRDFNVTPVMVSHLFGIPTEGFLFPSFRERYRIGSAAVSDTAPVAAVLTRAGMVPVADAADIGRKLWLSVILNTVFCLLGTVLGMALLFVMFRGGSLAAVGVGRILLYLLVWSLPVILTSIWQSR